ncbi:hypothetical protein Psi02_46530 [Planotetraspora silvatica]|uniref:Uncharacterized protein n=1 Tax=Planotetraspora silvatica TaxID=234614 RepID=A0A8J3XPA1_9ACTN|nr:hypothetical protein Psi02_46530 [Planotetraspora silvatica]
MDGVDPAEAVGVAEAVGAASAGAAEPAITDAVRVKMENARCKRTCPPGPYFSAEGDTCAEIFQGK